MERRGGDYGRSKQRYRHVNLDNTSDDGGDSETSSTNTAPTPNNES